jgi:hypothetical protein
MVKKPTSTGKFSQTLLPATFQTKSSRTFHMKKHQWFNQRRREVASSTPRTSPNSPLFQLSRRQQRIRTRGQVKLPLTIRHVKNLLNSKKTGKGSKTGKALLGLGYGRRSTKKSWRSSWLSMRNSRLK